MLEKIARFPMGVNECDLSEWKPSEIMKQEAITSVLSVVTVNVEDSCQ